MSIFQSIPQLTVSCHEQNLQVGVRNRELQANGVDGIYRRSGNNSGVWDQVQISGICLPYMAIYYTNCRP